MKKGRGHGFVDPKDVRYKDFRKKEKERERMD